MNDELNSLMNGPVAERLVRTVIVVLTLLGAVSVVDAIMPTGTADQGIDAATMPMPRWPEWMPETVSAWRPMIEAAAAEAGMPVELVAVVVLIESGGDPEAVSRSGARGLMQIMPGTATEIQTRTGLPCAEQPFDPETSVRCGASYLASVRRVTFATDLADVGAGYNCGPGCLASALRYGTPLPAEAVRYWYWAHGMLSEWGEPASPTFTGWMAAGGHLLVARAADWQIANVR